MDDVRVEIEIDASPERVWQVLTDFTSYPGWNPLITSAGGTAKTDSVLNLRLKTSQSRAVGLKARVLSCERNRQIRWTGKAWGLPLLLENRHSCTLEPLPGGRTRLVQQGSTNGILRSLVGSTADTTRQGLEAMNRALKTRAEGGSLT